MTTPEPICCECIKRKCKHPEGEFHHFCRKHTPGDFGVVDTPEPTVEEVLEKLQKANRWRKEGGFAQQPEFIDPEKAMLISALQAVLAMCSRNGYTTWDRNKVVPLIDGKYNVEGSKNWEAAHGHDIRLKCYPEFGCQLLLDPSNVREAIEGELR